MGDNFDAAVDAARGPKLADRVLCAARLCVRKAHVDDGVGLCGGVVPRSKPSHAYSEGDKSSTVDGDATSGSERPLDSDRLRDGIEVSCLKASVPRSVEWRGDDDEDDDECPVAREAGSSLGAARGSGAGPGSTETSVGSTIRSSK